MLVRSPFRSLSAFLASSLIAIIVMDRLFYDCSPGWILGLALMIGAVVVISRHPYVVHDLFAFMMLSLLMFISASTVFSHGILAPSLGVALLIITAWWARGARYGSVVNWLSALSKSPLAVFAQIGADRRILKAWRLIHNTRIPGAGLLVWFIPVLIGIVFVIIFATANPIISNWFSLLGTWLSAWLNPAHWFPTPMQIVLWWGIGLLSWILLRVHAPRLAPSRRAIPAQDIDRTALIVRSLVIVNVVFSLQILLDLGYLVGGLQLPSGMTYATYAHRGAYPLLLAAVISAILVLAAFRPNGAAQHSSWARRLVFLWLGQNVALTIAAAWRLWLYVDAYGLSTWRISAALWMGLVACGLLLIAVRIAIAQSNRWLINANACAATLVLVFCCWLNVGGIIAWHNIRHCQEVGGYGVAIDLDYLNTFGEEIAPAVRWLAENSRDPAVAKRAGHMAFVRQHQARSLLEDWRSWTWVRASVAALPEAIAPRNNVGRVE